MITSAMIVGVIAAAGFAALTYEPDQEPLLRFTFLVVSLGIGAMAFAVTTVLIALSQQLT